VNGERLCAKRQPQHHDIPNAQVFLQALRLGLRPQLRSVLIRRLTLSRLLQLWICG